MEIFTINNRQFEIREFDAVQDSITELTGLLHRSYKVLADMGLNFMATHQDDTVTKKRIEKGDSFVTRNDGKLIACISVYKSKGTSKCRWYNNKSVAYFGQFAVEPYYQKLGIGSRIMEFIEEFAKEKQMLELSLDTSEQALHLIEYYKKRGYRFIQYHKWNEVNYRSIILSKKL